ncbi:MAG TPA: hypothetical protein VFV30_12390, partial [Novosphingobium sp.]|nr:hypothetical protein [Novosphingobium sp.]
MRFQTALMTLSALLAASAAAVSAQDVDQVVHMDGPGVTAVPAQRVAQPVSNPLTAAQQKAISQGKALRPGVYRLRSVHSGGCLATNFAVPRFLFQLSSCGTELIGNMYYGDDGLNLAILPHPAGGYTVRSAHPAYLGWVQNGLRAPVNGEYGNCLTVARGVILGAPRIELLPCDSAGDWTRTGADDQRFFFLPSGPGTYQIALALTGDGTDCWALRNGSRDSQTDVIRWQCNRTADQMWEPRWI